MAKFGCLLSFLGLYIKIFGLNFHLILADSIAQQISLWRLGFDSSPWNFSFVAVNINDLHTLLYASIFQPLRRLGLHFLIVRGLFSFLCVLVNATVLGAGHSVGSVLVWVNILLVSFNPGSLDSIATVNILALIIECWVTSTRNLHMAHLFRLWIKVSLAISKTVHVTMMKTIQGLGVGALWTQQWDTRLFTWAVRELFHVHLLLVAEDLLELSLTFGEGCSSTWLFLVFCGLNYDIWLFRHLSLSIHSRIHIIILLLFNNVHILIKSVDAWDWVHAVCGFLMLGATCMALSIETIFLVVIFVQKCGAWTLVLGRIFRILQLILEWLRRVLIINEARPLTTDKIIISFVLL